MMGKVLWFTGLSGSGKSTIANLFKEKLEAIGKKVKIFDGDDVRNTLHKHLGFTPEDIKENNRLIAGLCKAEMENYDFILVPIISPFKESRLNVRKELGKDFIEVYIKCSLEECVRRDVKGLYKKAFSGEIKNFIGVDSSVPYEIPENPHLILNTEKEALERAVNKLLNLVLN